MPRQIKQQIENIIDYRKRTRLPKIEQQIAFLKDVLSKVEKLDSVIATVRYQIEQKNGPYYTMLLADPTMEARFNIVSTTGIKEKLKKQIELLELLKRRFSRDAVQVAFVGYERQGKSRFLQSISGLSNNVIPAYSGTSCTGAVSVIHNVGSGFSATIKFYTLAEEATQCRFVQIGQRKRIRLRHAFDSARSNFQQHIFTVAKIHCVALSKQRQ